MFECPGCKHIVDDSIKKCPNCSYDIKKFIKSKKNEAKRTGKNFGEETIALSSVYSPGAKNNKVLPQLDFLSKPTGLSNPNLKEIPNQPIFDSPSLNAAANNAKKDTTRTFGEPSMTKIIEEPVFESPSLNKKESFVSTPVDTSKNKDKDAPFGGATDIGFKAPGLGVSVVPPSTGKAPTAESGYGSLSIPAPNAAAPERQPIVHTDPVTPPTPVYNDASVEKQSIFDSPLLNANTTSTTVTSGSFKSNTVTTPTTPSTLNATSALLDNSAKPSSILSENSDIKAQGYGMNTGAKTIASSPSGSVGGATEGIFDSPILNEQARAIAEGRYVPTSVATQASLADLNKPRIPGALTHNTVSQGPSSSYKDPAHQGAMYGKEVQKPSLTNFNGLPANNGYNSSASAEIYLGNPLLAKNVAPSALPPNPIAQNMGNTSGSMSPEVAGAANTEQNQQTVFSPTYSSFGTTKPSVGAPNPLLSGNATLNSSNPLLGGGSGNNQ